MMEPTEAPVQKADPKFGSPDKSAPCPPCKERFGVDKYHRHHSTRWYHDCERREGRDEVDCECCKVRHSIEPPARGRIVIFTSSTLHNVYMDPRVKTDIHVDVESICGGRLRDLYLAWQMAYGSDTTPIHIVIVSGLNDVRNVGPSGFDNILLTWFEQIFDLNESSTIRMCKLLRTPSQCWFPGNGPLPTANYVNYLSKVNSINGKIDQFNERLGHSKVIGFACDGCRTRKREVRHKITDWREAQRGAEHCLHLNSNKRYRMFLKLMRYITHQLQAELPI